MLEKKEKVLQKKASAEVEKAKDFTRAKNKRGMDESFVGNFKFLDPVLLMSCGLGIR